MKFKIEKEVFDQFPQLVVYIPVVRGFDNNQAHEKSVKFMRDCETALKTNLTKENFGKDQRVLAYYDCFRKFGADPGKFRPTHVALAKRVLEGGELPDINPMVNIYNAISIKYLTPFGGEDLNALYGDFVLKIAKGGEHWIGINAKESKPCVKGELIWGDDYDVSTRALNWRQCDRTMLTEGSHNGYFVMDGFSGVNEENIKKASEEFVKVATELFGGKVEILYLSKEHPEAEIQFATKKMSEKEREQLSNVKVAVKYAEKVKAVREPSASLESFIWEDTESLEYKIRKVIFEVVKDLTVTDFSINEVVIEHPKVESFGDYSTNIALQAFKLLQSNRQGVFHHQLPVKAASSRELASIIVGKINKKCHDDNAVIIDKAEVAGPGFINIRLKTDYLTGLMGKIIEKQSGKMTFPLKAKKMAVEYTDPNPFKEFHLGHLYSNFIGESLARLLEANGATVWRGDFYGDVGMHIAKSLYGFLAILKIKNKKLNILQGEDYIKELKMIIAGLDKLPTSERQKILGEGYALGVNKFEGDEIAVREIKDINLLIYVSAQEILIRDKGWQPLIDYRKFTKGNLDRLPEIEIVYEAGLKWSLEYFESIYKRLGTKFDGYYPESWVGEFGLEIAQKGLKMGVLEDSDGTVVYKGEKDGLHTRVFVNKMGLPTYESKDLGLAKAKHMDFPYDWSVNVFGKEIDEYYQVVRVVMRQIEPELGKRANYVAHGMVKLPEGKMASRKGNVITTDWLLNEAKNRVLGIMKNTDVKTEKEKELVAEKVGIAAVRYALLKGGPTNDVVFDFDKSLSFEGDSGPYLMYTYARCKSVLRKAQNTVSSIKYQVLSINNKKIPNTRYPIPNTEYNSEELSVLRSLYRFDEVVTEAARTLSPNMVAAFLYDLAKKFNLFYNKHTILGTDNIQHLTFNIKNKNEKNKKQANLLQPTTNNLQQIMKFRLMLTEATSIILKQGLQILGIETVERM